LAHRLLQTLGSFSPAADNELHPISSLAFHAYPLPFLPCLPPPAPALPPPPSFFARAALLDPTLVPPIQKWVSESRLLDDRFRGELSQEVLAERHSYL
jgi:hypothetical protein